MATGHASSLAPSRGRWPLIRRSGLRAVSYAGLKDPSASFAAGPEDPRVHFYKR